MESDESRRIAASTARRTGKAPSAEEVANAIVATLRDVYLVLTPILGLGGVAALYRRSLFLCSSRHKCLCNFEGSDPDFAWLRSLLAEQSSDTAIIYGDDLLKTFNDLLTSLIGSSLCERLLRSVWENSLSGTPSQDTSP